MSKRRGLPDALSSRHGQHYVDALGEEPVGQLIPVNQIRPNEEQPRKTIGDLSGLKASIREKGIIEPIVIRRHEGKYLIVSGERRYRAALELGLDRLPCIIRTSDDLDSLEVGLIENLQRKDLTPFEEADGLRSLSENHGLTHDEIAGKIGKSRNSVTETLSLTAIPQEIRSLCSNHGITAKSMLLQIARQETAAEMLDLAQQIIKKGMTRTEVRAERRKGPQTSPKPHIFRHKPKDGKFTVTVKFKKSDASREELIKALESALRKLREEGAVGTPTNEVIL